MYLKRMGQDQMILDLSYVRREMNLLFLPSDLVIWAKLVAKIYPLRSRQSIVRGQEVGPEAVLFTMSMRSQHCGRQAKENHVAI